MRRMVTDSAQLNRATLGVTLNQTGSKRDTLGIFISAVAENGPAERAGIFEGDRIAAINGVDVRTTATDAGDSYLAGVAHRRLTLEMRKLTAGQRVNLRVWSGGRYKDVQVTTARYAEVYPNRGRTISIGSGGMWTPGVERTIRVAPMMRNRTMIRTPRVAPMHFDGARIHLDAMEHALTESKVALEAARAGAVEHAKKALIDVEGELLDLEPMILEMEHLFDGDDHLIDPLDDVLLDTMESGDQVSSDPLDANDAGELAREAVRQAEATLRAIGEIEVADSGAI
jgi:hypothetical protein